MSCAWLQRLCIVATLLACAAPGLADSDVPLELTGPLEQGSLVVGRTDPAASVRFRGDPVRVSANGEFLIGFGRDAPATETLEVRLPDGPTLERKLEVERRNYAIQEIDGVEPAKVEPPEEAWPRIREEIRLVAEARRLDDARTDFAEGFRWPLEGAITGVYGSQRVYNGEPRRPHYGIDIAASTGTVVRAPASGVVTVAHPDMYFSGGTMLLDHGHGLSSAFLHLSELYVGVGDRVEQGDPIAEVGAGGRSTGAHLDWRINLFGQRLDPAFLVEPMPGSSRMAAE